jgi:hypothetical protein
MAAMVAGPIAKRSAGDVAGAERDFDALLASRTKEYGASSLEVADTLSSFGVTLYSNDFKSDALPYLRKAPLAYKAHFGPDHPEVALAYCDLATAEKELFGKKIVEEEDAAFEECLRIRLKTLGPDNAETALVMGDVARMKGRPEFTHGDEARIEAAGALYDEAIAGYRNSCNGKAWELDGLRQNAAEMYRLNNREAAAKKYDQEDDAGWPDKALTGLGCWFRRTF